MSKKKKFNDDTCLFIHKDGLVRYSPALAQEMGEKESLLFLQFEFWLVTLEGCEKDGRKWVYQSMGNIQERFPSWGHKTIFRILKSLEENNYILSRGDLNKRKGDQTKWYSINFDSLSPLESLRIRRTDPVLPVGQKEPRGVKMTIPVGQKVQNNVKMTIPVGQKEPTLPESSSESLPEKNSEKEEDIFLIKNNKEEKKEINLSPTTANMIRNKEKLHSLISDILQRVTKDAI